MHFLSFSFPQLLAFSRNQISNIFRFLFLLIANSFFRFPSLSCNPNVPYFISHCRHWRESERLRLFSLHFPPPSTVSPRWRSAGGEGVTRKKGVGWSPWPFVLSATLHASTGSQVHTRRWSWRVQPSTVACYFNYASFSWPVPVCWPDRLATILHPLHGIKK